ncbi:hypothetical protein Tco_1148369, partial [Tanacetum coccineum]
MEFFSVEVGLHQGSAISPYLFALILDELSRGIQEDIPWCMSQNRRKLENWREALEANGLRVSREKTKYLRCDFSNSFACEWFACLVSFLLSLFGFCVLDSDRLERWASFRLGGSMEGFEGLVGLGLPLFASSSLALWCSLLPFPFACFGACVLPCFACPFAVLCAGWAFSALFKLASVLFIFSVPLCAFCSFAL